MILVMIMITICNVQETVSRPGVMIRP